MVKIQNEKLRQLMALVKDGDRIDLWPELATLAVNSLPPLLDIYENKRLLIYQQIDQERIRQRDHGDTLRPRAAWASLLKDYVNRSIKAGNDGDQDDFRYQMIVIASLCVAAVEAQDRRRDTEPMVKLDPVCGSLGVDEDGYCIRCGLRPDGRMQCPPGFLATDRPR